MGVEEYENEIIRLTNVLDTITNFEDIEDMEESAANAGLSYVEYLEMAYENIRGVALSAIMEERKVF